jgi:hypothetical protein
MPFTIIGYGQGGYGQGGYGGGELFSFSPGCAPLLKDPAGNFWQLGVTDNGSLTTTEISIPIITQSGPVISLNGVNWQLSAGISGDIIATAISSGQLGVPYLPLISPSNLFWNVTITPNGSLQTTSTSTLSPEIIPHANDVSMSVYGTKDMVICTSCGNSTVTVSADLSCWCCSCNTFVKPEDTNIIVILDE